MFQPLTNSQIEQLQTLGNRAEDWSRVLAAPGFDPSCCRNNLFLGRVCLGAMQPGFLTDGLLRLPEGVSNSTLADATIGDHCALCNVRMLSGYTVGSHSLLFNIDEMTAAQPGSAFEHPWLEPMNENGGRRIIPFAGMTIADAYLWAKYRDHGTMVGRLETLTRSFLDSPEGSRGQVGSHCIIKNTRTLRNVAVRSDAETPTRIEDCVILADGVVGYGCHCLYGCIAERFLLGENVCLEYGVRLNDTVVGDNSTIARCEVGNNIIFPAHEQHHNNSFLIASVVMGQSNLAAGCTVGSNHNGRTADNEIVAGRGFWPGLCTSLKHSSAFASYCLLAKGDYPAELSITLPFALVSNNTSLNRLEVMPAYWWMYNMYALHRNISKFAKRDKRTKKAQHIVFSPFAPDTAEEIINGRLLLKGWIEQAYQQSKAETGKKIEVFAYGMEKGRRKVAVLKWAEGYQAYEQMLIYYAMSLLAADNPSAPLPPSSLGDGKREDQWVNLGGQLVPQCLIDQLIADIENGRIDTWDQIHQRYSEWNDLYSELARRHAYHTLCLLAGTRTLNAEQWQQFLIRYADIQHYVEEQRLVTRQKDDDNPYRRMTYRNDAEMKAVLS